MSAIQVGLLVLWGDSLTYTLAKALSFTGYAVKVFITDAQRHFKAASRSGLSARISDIPGVHLTVIGEENTFEVEELDRLIVQGHPLLLGQRACLDRLAASAARITAITYGDRNRRLVQAWHLQLREWRWFGRWWEKVERVANKDGFYIADPFALLKPRVVIGFDPHSSFLHDDRLYARLHGAHWEIEVPRRWRFNFIGSRDPDSRRRILERIEQSFDVTEKRIFWHTYTDAEPAGLEPEAFLDVLTGSDFTLAPRGYSLVTHRPIEALLMGSIPVLDERELDLYGLDLRDGINCIAVKREDWPSTIRRILTMRYSTIVQMRETIKDMHGRLLDYPVLARNICRRLGLTSLIVGPHWLSNQARTSPCEIPEIHA